MGVRPEGRGQRDDRAPDRLSARTRHTLIRAGICTLSQVAALDDRELVAIPQLGPRGIAEIRSVFPGPASGAADDGRPAQADETLLAGRLPAALDTRRGEERRHQPVRCDAAFGELPRRVVAGLVRAGITTLRQLAALTDDELRECRNLGPKGIADVRALLTRHAVPPPPRAARSFDYTPYLPQLLVAHSVPLASATQLSVVMVYRLAEASIRSVAEFVLCDLDWPGARLTVSLGQLRDEQQRLAAIYGLGHLADMANQATLAALQTRLGERGATPAIQQLAELFDRACDLLLAEIAAGRLAEAFAVRSIVFGHSAAGNVVPLSLDVLRRLANGEGATLQLTENELAAYVQRADRLVAGLAATTVDDEVAFLRAALTDRSYAILRDRFDPFEALTLGQLGQRHQLTRERIHQLQAKATGRLRELSAQQPLARIRSATYFAAELAAAGRSLAEIEADLQARGLIAGDEAFGDLLVIWQALALEPAFVREQVAAAGAGLTPTQVGLRARIARRATTLCRNCGALRCSWLGEAAPDDDLAAALRALGFAEIAPGWFRRDRIPREVVATVARKVFAVTDPLSPRDFRRALLKRHARGGFPTPPTGMLARVALRLGCVREDAGLLIATRPFVPEEELNGSELALHRCLIARGPVATYQDLFAAIRGGGYTAVTLTVRLKQSPIIRKVRHGLYALVGARSTDEDVAAAAARIGEVGGEGSLEADADGTATYSLNAGPWLFSSGVISAGELAPFRGTWTTPQGIAVTIGKANVWGLKPFVEHLGLQLGDRFALRLNLRDRTLVVERPSVASPGDPAAGPSPSPRASGAH